MATLLGTSRFIKTPLIQSRSGKITYGLIEGFNKIKFITENNFTYYTVPNGLNGRPDLIARDYYGNSHLEWVIVLANRPKNTLNWPSIGDVIKIPNDSFVRSVI